MYVFLMFVVIIVYYFYDYFYDLIWFMDQDLIGKDLKCFQVFIVQFDDFYIYIYSFYVYFYLKYF